MLLQFILIDFPQNINLLHPFFRVEDAEVIIQFVEIDVLCHCAEAPLAARPPDIQSAISRIDTLSVLSHRKWLLFAELVRRLQALGFDTRSLKCSRIKQISQIHTRQKNAHE